jgi:hypothetical protein
VWKRILWLFSSPLGGSPETQQTPYAGPARFMVHCPEGYTQDGRVGESWVQRA